MRLEIRRYRSFFAEPAEVEAVPSRDALGSWGGKVRNVDRIFLGGKYKYSRAETLFDTPRSTVKIILPCAYLDT